MQYQSGFPYVAECDCSPRPLGNVLPPPTFSRVLYREFTFRDVTTRGGGKVMRLTILQAIWQRCTAVLHTARVSVCYSCSVQVSTRSINLVIFAIAVGEVVFWVTENGIAEFGATLRH